MRRFLTYFLRGLVLLAPIVVTIYICVRLFVTIDGWLNFRVPGAGFVVTIMLITLVGFLASTILARGLVALFDSMMARLPFVRFLYSSTKDLMSAFVGEKRRFDKPVLVPFFPGSHALTFGFVTQESLTLIGLPGHVAVYVPQSYNFAGALLVLPADQITRVNADSKDVMAFIVSGGVTTVPGRGRIE